MAMKKRFYTVDGQMVGYEEGGVRKDFLTDHLGSIIAIMDENEVRVFDTRYSAYGRNRWITGTSCGFGWVGTYGYRETGLFKMSHYVRARHYSYTTGTWSTVDPLWPDESAYGYVGGKSTRKADPSGLGDSIGDIRRDCKQKSKQACFACAYDRITKLRFRDHIGKYKEYIPPQEACELANQICGTHTVCGPCGPGPGPVLPGNDVCDLGFWQDWAWDNLHNGKVKGVGCGNTGWDKLAHCFVGCLAGTCEPTISYWVCRHVSSPDIEDDPFDRDANWIGWDIGSGDVLTPQECLSKCAKAVRGLPGHE